MIDKLLQPFNPEKEEKVILELWDSNHIGHPESNVESGSIRKDAPVYTIVMPPPNANGNLHAGHALGITLQDLIARYHRMKGDRTLLIPGADHAGFETQVVYEKKLEKEGRSRFGMDPKALYDEIYAFTLENKSNMESQVRALGASCDWSRNLFTLDPKVVENVQKTFLKMYSDGLIYRGKRTINWCPKHQTSLSDVETESVEEGAKLYYFKYGPFEIATARPETKFGDKYVVVHPEDKRYSAWQHGEKFTVEWINGPIEATVIKDPVIDQAFGTGVMTITPWHSAIDFDLAQKHHLDVEQIIDWRGKLLPIAEEFSGISIKDAREKIVAKLQSKGLLIRIEENYKHIVKRCYKCNTLIEPQIKDQWFVKMRPLADLALQAVNERQVTFIPDNYEKIFRYWMENTLDWNISRQIVWGIPIPAWLCDGCGTHKAKISGDIPSCEACRKPMRKESDTFDTWFSSGQWPLLVTGFPDGKDFSTYYPTQMMETGHDLIFKWIPRMVIFGLYLTKKSPFSQVYLHGLVNDAQGKKMSKSKGNVVNPLELTKKYGTDALRMGLIVGNTPGSDLALREDKIRGYKHFANKVWNASRFVVEQTHGKEIGEHLLKSDQQTYDQFFDLLKDITKDIDEYRYYLAAEKLYHYFWHTFADIIIEETKNRMKEGTEEEKASARKLLTELLSLQLRVLHPFIPFVTESLWNILPPEIRAYNLPLALTPWPLK